MASLNTYTCRGLAPLSVYLPMSTWSEIKEVMNLRTWNICSMVDTEGPIEIPSRGQRGKERKVDWIVREMKQCDVKVVGLQETKWFGSRCMMCRMLWC